MSMRVCFPNRVGTLRRPRPDTHAPGRPVHTVRLDQAKLGIGLLPIVPIGITFILVPLFIPTHGTNKYPRIVRPHFFPWALTCLVFGVLSCVLVGVRLNSLIGLGQVVNMDKNIGKSKQFYYNGTRKVSRHGSSSRGWRELIIRRVGERSRSSCRSSCAHFTEHSRSSTRCSGTTIRALRCLGITGALTDGSNR